MQIRNGEVSFNKFKGSGPRSARTEVVFDNPVDQATALLRTLDVSFSPRDDHHLGQLEVGLEATIDPLAPQRVNIDVVYGLRDWSNDWDDNYEGVIQFTVIAD